jgi:hypothetical protein
MFRRCTHAAALVLAACAAANAGIIAFSVNGGAVQFVPVAGAFNTGANTNCGIAGNCNEVSAFNVVDASGLTFNGNITFTTNDAAGFSTSALEQVTMTVDNPNAAGVINLVVAFVSDQFDPSIGGPAGVGIFGTFPSDNNGAFVSADAQGEMDFSNAGFGGVPGFGSFALRTPLVGGINLPAGTPFWTFITTPNSPAGINNLVGFVGVDVAAHSEVSFPISIEDDDTAILTSEAPEPVSYLMFGGGLVAFGMLLRKRVRPGKASTRQPRQP